MLLVICGGIRIGNALKYSSKREEIAITVGFEVGEGETTFSITDNGAGFDMRHYGNIFGVFQRLHQNEEFAGTGVGLANVQRIINKHGGEIRAEGVVDKGATFWFSVPHEQGTRDEGQEIRGKDWGA